MNEIWKDIKGYEGLYQVSNLGRVRSVDRYVKQKEGFYQYIKGRIRKSKLNNGGYMLVSLSKDNKGKTFLIHRLVAQAFIPNSENKPQVNHIDENPCNNCVDNLEWCDAKYNCNYGNHSEKLSKAFKRKVAQYTLDGIYVKTWNSYKEAGLALNINRGNISNCVNNRCKSCGGYIWKKVA